MKSYFTYVYNLYSSVDKMRETSTVTLLLFHMREHQHLVSLVLRVPLVSALLFLSLDSTD